MKINYNRFYYNPLPNQVYIQKSSIDGHGIFAKQNIKKDTLLKISLTPITSERLPTWVIL